MILRGKKLHSAWFRCSSLETLVFLSLTDSCQVMPQQASQHFQLLLLFVNKSKEISPLLKIALPCYGFPPCVLGPPPDNMTKYCKTRVQGRGSLLARFSATALLDVNKTQYRTWLIHSLFTMPLRKKRFIWRAGGYILWTLPTRTVTFKWLSTSYNSYILPFFFVVVVRLAQDVFLLAPTAMWHSCYNGSYEGA